MKNKILLFIFKHEIFFNKYFSFIGKYCIKNIQGIGTSMGHDIYTFDFKKWFYDDGVLTQKVRNTKKCKKCDCIRIDGKYDNCLGKIEGATSACCGHGIDDGYVTFNNYNITANEYKKLK
jgi:hypothetical protein